MGKVTVEKNLSGIPGLCLITPTVYRDSRGYFYESYSERDLEDAGIYIDFVQDNQSRSSKGVLRGLHFQKLFPQTKLVRVIKGEVFDVAVDLRKDSPTYLRWHGEILSETNFNQLLIPQGFAHGFLVLSDVAEFCYKCDDFYHPDDEAGIAWNDPTLSIVWPHVTGKYLGSASAAGYKFDDIDLNISEKDVQWEPLKTKGRS